MGKKRSSRWGLPASDSRREVLTFRTNHRARSFSATVPRSRAYDPRADRCNDFMQLSTSRTQA